MKTFSGNTPRPFPDPLLARAQALDPTLTAEAFAEMRRGLRASLEGAEQPAMLANKGPSMQAAASHVAGSLWRLDVECERDIHRESFTAQAVDFWRAHFDCAYPDGWTLEAHA